MPNDLWLPKRLTDEELVLKEKYKTLRQLKKAVNKEEEKSMKQGEMPKESPIKLAPAQAKEQAKKLVLAGKISLSSKSKGEKTTFKRPTLLEKKVLSSTTLTSTNDGTQGFLGFTPRHSIGGGSHAEASSSPNPIPITRAFDQEQQKGSFLMAGISSQVPKRGPVIYISVTGGILSEAMLRMTFARFSRILNIKIIQPTVAFVTFATDDGAALAIDEMNGSIHNGIEYQVEFARRQPSPFMKSTHHNSWASDRSFSSSTSNQSGMKRSWDYKREQVVYEDDDDDME